MLSIPRILKSNSLGIESAADTCSTENVVKTQPKFYKEQQTLFIFTKYKICLKTGSKPSRLIFFQALTYWLTTRYRLKLTKVCQDQSKIPLSKDFNGVSGKALSAKSPFATANSRFSMPWWQTNRFTAAADKLFPLQGRHNVHQLSNLCIHVVCVGERGFQRN